MKNKILFVTSRNILTTSGELRLIKNRMESIYKYNGIATDFLVLQKRDRINSSKRETISAGGNIDTIELKKLFGSSMRKLKKEVIKRMETNEYSAVVFSGFLMIGLSKYVKKYNVKIGIDIHGASEDILYFASNNGFLSRLKAKLVFKIDNKLSKKYFKYADFSFVVTRDLQQYVIDRFRPSKHIKFFVAPCATNEDILHEEFYLENREIYRNKYSIDKDDIVFIYSGGVSKWQCIDETIELVNKLSLVIKNAKFLFFSHNVDYLKSKINSPNIIIDSYGPDELEKALCAGDYAFLIRNDSITNNVAFPNKYLEYVKAGMKIITTPYLHEVSNQIREFDNGFLYKFEDNIDDLLKYVLNGNRKIDFEKINQILKLNGFENTLKDFSEALK